MRASLYESDWLLCYALDLYASSSDNLSAFQFLIHAMDRTTINLSHVCCETGVLTKKYISIDSWGSKSNN